MDKTGYRTTIPQRQQNFNKTNRTIHKREIPNKQRAKTTIPLPLGAPQPEIKLKKPKLIIIHSLTKNNNPNTSLQEIRCKHILEQQCQNNLKHNSHPHQNNKILEHRKITPTINLLNNQTTKKRMNQNNKSCKTHTLL
jgi:hypothetical protein